jgi:hypothetical protein
MSDDLFLRACRAYEAHCSRNGYVDEQPARHGRIFAQRFYLLTYCHGVLHTFRYVGGRLRTVDVSSVPEDILGVAS